MYILESANGDEYEYRYVGVKSFNMRSSFPKGGIGDR